MEEKSLALTVNDALKLGEVLYKSGYFADVKNAAQAVVKILRGQELGIPPVTALEQVYVISGKTALGASLIASKIKASGKYNYKIKRLDDSGCELIFYENGKEVGTSVFAFEDAKKAGLTSRETWQKYPRNLYFARALSNGAKWYCPDVFSGAIYVPEELEGIQKEITVAVEELIDKQKENKPAIEEPKKINGVRNLSEAQVKLLYGKAKSKGLSDEALHKMINEVVGKESVKDLNSQDLDVLLDVIEQM